MNKPKIGEPCNGCGICCLTQVCRNGAYLLKLVNELGEFVSGRCPALVQRDGRFFCDIILNPKKYIKQSKYPAAVLSRNFGILTGAGTGCDELLENDSEEEEMKLAAIVDRYKSDKELQRKAKIALKVIHNLDF
ncbi:MAG: hypothetical protein LBS69_07845 [Prevotellaceae bacterium]|jgi:hypothetical protein|nr:hypothetical protein [Prevotellaceae bacterium]